MPVGQADDHHTTTVRANEILPVGPIQGIPGFSPISLVQGHVTDHAKMTQNGGCNIFQRQFDLLPAVAPQSVTFSGQKRRDAHVSRDQVPGRQRIGDRVLAVLRAGDVRNAERRVDGVIHLRPAMPVARQGHHHKVFAMLAQRIVVHPAPDPEIGKKQTRIVARRGDDTRDHLAPLRRLHVDGNGFFALVHSGPEEALSVRCKGPSPGVKTTAKTVKPDNLGPHLCQRHPCERNGDKSRPLDDAHTGKNAHCASSQIAVACMH